MLKIEARIASSDEGILMHNIDGGFVNTPEKRRLEELTAMPTKLKKLPETVAEMQEIEWTLGLYLDGQGFPTIPNRVMAAAIRDAAKLSRDGQSVRRALQVTRVRFHYEPERATVEELRQSPDHRLAAVVAVQRQKILRVRPLFKNWSAQVSITADSEMCSAEGVREWLERCGNFIGIGDWRRDKGGSYGGFTIEEYDVQS